MFSLIQDFLQVESSQIYYHYYKQNKTPENNFTLVLLHDSLGCITLWRDWPKFFAEHLDCNVLVYDRVGYGKSQKMSSVVRSLDYLQKEAYFLNNILDLLQIKQVCLFGYSDGASIALLYGALFPMSTKGIISIAGHVFVEQITIEGVNKFKEEFNKGDLAVRLEKYHPEKVNDLVNAWVNTWTSEQFKAWSIEDLLDKIISPLLFIQGDQDQYGSLDQIIRTFSKVKGLAISKIYPGATHSVPKERTMEIRQETLDFMSTYVRDFKIKD
ncbi:alpha/beta fold hydrolase [Myroides sp. LJL119]